VKLRTSGRISQKSRLSPPGRFDRAHRISR
jgi:hypothetical protein